MSADDYQPISLINWNEYKSQFEINSEALDQLNTLDGPIAVIGVAGLYRTGKSYILNRLAGSNKGFSIGSSVEPCTFGIHMWIVDMEYLPGRVPRGMNLVLLDTEGLGSYKKSKTYDVQIFALTILLSSFFIYNSMGTIDEKALDRLSLVTELTKAIRVQLEGSDMLTDSSLFRHFFPKFLWLLRDFSLRLEKDGVEITPVEYLESALKPIKSNEDGEESSDSQQAEVEAKNEIRASINQFFPERYCFTLKRPVANESLLQNLENANEDDIRPVFLKEMEELLDLIWSKLEPKKMFKSNLNGRQFSRLVQNYVQSLNNGSIPTIKTAWENVVYSEISKAINESFEVFNQRWTLHSTIEKDLRDGQASVDSESIYEIYEIAKDEAIETFDRLTNGFSNSTKDSLQRTVEARLELKLKMKDKLKSILILNSECSRLKNTKQLEQIATGIERNIQNNESFKFEDLENIWNADINSNYSGSGPKKYEILSYVLKSKPFQQANMLHRRLIASLRATNEKGIDDVNEKTRAEIRNLESLLEDVKSSWLRSKDDYRLLEAENEKLIGVISNLSLAINENCAS